MNSLDQTEDLKAYERRVVEIVSCLQPATYKWRVILIVFSVFTTIGAWMWLTDPKTFRESLLQSLYMHPTFTICATVLIILFFYGIHRRVVAPSIIVGRLQNVLEDFNMSCDENGRLLLRPWPKN